MNKDKRHDLEEAKKILEKLFKARENWLKDCIGIGKRPMQIGDEVVAIKIAIDCINEVLRLEQKPAECSNGLP